MLLKRGLSKIAPVPDDCIGCKLDPDLAEVVGGRELWHHRQLEGLAVALEAHHHFSSGIVPAEQM